MKNVIKAPVEPGPFQGKNIHRLLDHADLASVPSGAAAQIAGVYLREVLAHGTEDNALLDAENGLGQLLGSSSGCRMMK